MCERCDLCADFNLVSAALRVSLAKLAEEMKSAPSLKTPLADVAQLVAQTVKAALVTGAVLGADDLQTAMRRAKDEKFDGVLLYKHDIIHL